MNADLTLNQRQEVGSQTQRGEMKENITDTMKKIGE
jgi:hypothetical protein